MNNKRQNTHMLIVKVQCYNDIKLENLLAHIIN